MLFPKRPEATFTCHTGFKENITMASQQRARTIFATIVLPMTYKVAWSPKL